MNMSSSCCFRVSILRPSRGESEQKLNDDTRSSYVLQLSAENLVSGQGLGVTTGGG
jgi:hypothetical protein